MTEDIEFWECQAVLKYFGGGKPLHISTLYRGMAAGRYPRPVNVGASAVRWIAAECRTAALNMIVERSRPKPPTKRGRPKQTVAPIPEPARVEVKPKGKRAPQQCT